MINSNENLKKRRGNGTQCTGVAIKLKDDAAVSWKNWDGRRVRTVNVDDVEYITCELTNQQKEKSLFNLKPETDTVVITLQLYGKLHSIGGIKITQFGVNCNIATTGHKLQGTSVLDLPKESTVGSGSSGRPSEGGASVVYTSLVVP